MKIGICVSISNLRRRLAGGLVCVGLIIGGSSELARADDWLEGLLNSLLAISAGGSGGGCAGDDGVVCEDNSFCSNQCGGGFECSNKRCKRSYGHCVNDSQCSSAICNSVTKMCQSQDDNLTRCTRDEECASGNCNKQERICTPLKSDPQATGEGNSCSMSNSCRYPLRCVGGKCTMCSKFRETCSDNIVGRGCCSDSGLKCKGGMCVKEGSKSLGESCSGDEDCDASLGLGCFLDKCALKVGAECERTSDCNYMAGCINNVCQNCYDKLSGQCLLELGSPCKLDTDCESNNCSGSMCARAETACQDVSYCHKVPNPAPDKLSPICRDDGKCSFCVEVLKDIFADYACCEGEPQEGKCLLGLGELCSEGNECISGNCWGGQCQYDGYRGGVHCSSDNECQKQNQYWRCCLAGSKLSSDVCNSNNMGRCVAWIVCGNGCCEGTEDTQNCRADCPQNPDNRPDWCIPNIQLVEPVPLPSDDLAQRCRQSCNNRCSGEVMVTINQSSVNCDCKTQCSPGHVCSGGFCQEQSGVCYQRCASATITQTISFSDDHGYQFQCNCTGGTVSVDEDIAMVIETENCSTKKACKDASCLSSGYRCCQPSTNYYGDCAVFATEEPVKK